VQWVTVQLREQTAGGAARVALQNIARQRIFDLLKLDEIGYGDVIVERIGIVEMRLIGGTATASAKLSMKDLWMWRRAWIS
jgi:hypothetical protein